MKLQCSEYFFNFELDDDGNIIDCDEYPSDGIGYIKKSHIDKYGKLIIDRVDSLSFQEIMKNPIIHNRD